MLQIEIINPHISRKGFKYALFDFDGTVSLIREGWQQIMANMMVEVLLATPRAEDEATLTQLMTNYVTASTGQPTLNQMAHLAEAVRQRGGQPMGPQDYKRQYTDRLDQRVEKRVKQIKSGHIEPAELAVPGVINMLARLRQQDVTCYLASGTDEHHIINEARLLGVADYFNGGMYGARDNGRTVTKKMLINRILSEFHLSSHELVVFGDGNDEIYHAAQVGCLAIGVASNEIERQGINEVKRQQLIEVGADIIIPDFRESAALLQYLANTSS